MDRSPIIDPLRSALFTDLYQLTMAQAYAAEGMDQPAVFELFFRQMPAARRFIMAAGLDDVLTYLETFAFSDEDIAYLREQGQFSESFLNELRRLRFTGDVHAVAEGTIVFADEPLVQVVAPILQAQLVETFILNQIHYQSIAASKAARVVTAAAGRAVVDFGSRRAHGADAALKTARTSYLAGVAGTSNVLAGRMYGIPIFGTMAHAYVQAHDDEAAAFAAFARLYSETTLLVDTYDTLAGVRKLIDLARRLGDDFSVRAIRLDSGDLAELAKQSRRMLDEAGRADVEIFASSSLDEHKIERMLAAGAPIDGFGVGTSLAVSDDAPSLDMAYKLVEYAGRPRVKLSSHKVIYPQRKQIYRRSEAGQITGDTICRYDETLPGESLLVPVMQSGRRLPAGEVSLEQSRTHAKRQLATLPVELRSLEAGPAEYSVAISQSLQDALAELRRRH